MKCVCLGDLRARVVSVDVIRLHNLLRSSALPITRFLLSGSLRFKGEGDMQLKLCSIVRKVITCSYRLWKHKMETSVLAGRLSLRLIAKLVNRLS